MACWIRSRVGCEMGRAPVRTYDTVLADTPASLATSAMVGVTPSSFVAMVPRRSGVVSPASLRTFRQCYATLSASGITTGTPRTLALIDAPGLDPAQRVSQHPPGCRPARRLGRLQQRRWRIGVTAVAP